MKLLKQAVILCGGLGTRLKPITDTIPKPMVPVNGVPFLEELINHLKENGITKVLLLTGYLGEIIHEYFRENKIPNIQINYSHGPVEWDTGRRIWEARDKIEPKFLLLYGDNFAQFRMDGLARVHNKQQSIITLLLSRKEKGNIRLDKVGKIEVYDKTRTIPGLNYVEIGYMIVERDLMVNYFQDKDVSFSTILESMVNEGKLAGMVLGDHYHSVSDPERWKLTEKYLKPKKIILLDRDGVINKKSEKGRYVTSWNDFHWIPETLNALERLAKKGFEFVVLSNQAGIGRGIVSRATVDHIHECMKNVLKERGITVLKTYICPHHWEENCLCRKPNPGMFFEASKDQLLRLDRTFYIGDDIRDCKAAYLAGCQSILLTSLEGANVLQTLEEFEKPELIKENLLAAVPSILDQFNYWERML